MREREREREREHIEHLVNEDDKIRARSIVDVGCKTRACFSRSGLSIYIRRDLSESLRHRIRKNHFLNEDGIPLQRATRQQFENLIMNKLRIYIFLIFVLLHCVCVKDKLTCSGLIGKRGLGIYFNDNKKIY